MGVGNSGARGTFVELELGSEQIAYAAGPRPGLIDVRVAGRF